jgi:hypothetical protein
MEFENGQIINEIGLSLGTIAFEKYMNMNDKLKKKWNLHCSSVVRGGVCN